MCIETHTHTHTCLCIYIFDSLNNLNSSYFLKLLNIFNLVQHIFLIIHNFGHILDLIITMNF